MATTIAVKESTLQLLAKVKKKIEKNKKLGHVRLYYISNFKNS